MSRRQRRLWIVLAVKWAKFRQTVADLWAPPCGSCGGPAELCVGCAVAANPSWLKADTARYCPDCDIYFGGDRDTCPHCDSGAWCLASMLIRDPKRRKRVRLEHNLRLARKVEVMGGTGVESA